MSNDLAKKARRAPANLGVAAVSLLVGLLAGEIVLRLVPPPPPPLRFEGLAGRMADDPVQREVVLAAVESDPDLFWRLKPNTSLSANPWLPGLVANSQGLREAAEISRTKPAGELRVLFLGDSCTFGWGVRHEDSLVSQVESALRARLPGRAVECVNAGVPAYTAFQGWRYLATKGLDFQPDLVVATFGNNESISWDGRSDFEHHAAWLARRPPEGLRWSALARRAWLGFTAAPASDPEERRPRLSPDEFGEVLRRIHGAADSTGAATLFVAWPVRENLEPHRSAAERHPLQRVILSYMSSDPERAAPMLIDLVPRAHELAAGYPLSVLYADAIHGTALANTAYAQTVAGRIEAWAESSRPGA